MVGPQNGSVTTTSEAYEEELAYIVQNSPFTGDTLGSRGGQWLKVPGMSITHGSSHSFPANATWRGVPIFADALNTQLTDSYVSASASYLSHVFAVLRRHGVGDRGLIKFFDEPTMDTPTVNALRNIAGHIKAVAKASGVRVRLRVSGGVPTKALAAAYSPGVWDMHSDAFPWYSPYYSGSEQGPAPRFIDPEIQLSIYNNGVNLLSQPLLRTRTFFWSLFAANVGGALCWWSISDWKHGGPDFKNMFSADMGFNSSQLYGESGVLILPPQPGSGSLAPLDTLQWEQTLLGLQDFEYLHKLRKAVHATETLLSMSTDSAERVGTALTEGKAALDAVARVSGTG